jgi:hypothetical protein
MDNFAMTSDGGHFKFSKFNGGSIQNSNYGPSDARRC